MNASITTIPELLIQTRGNQLAVGRMVGLDRRSVKKYARDFEAKSHAIINGVLMVSQGNRGQKRKADAPDLVHS